MVEPFDVEEVRKYLKGEFGIDLSSGRILQEHEKLFYFSGRDIGIKGRHGMYIGSVKNGFRPSSYVIQLATKGITDVDEKQAMEWMCGLDIKKQAEGYYTAIRFGRYIIGVGKPKEGKIINNLPKNRRLPLSRL
jgi:NOL1/NOP2/fmu family ribosome biogenesis protein